MDDGFGYWLAGFIDGEGSFTISHRKRPCTYYNPRLRISVRDDDAEIVYAIQRETGIGSVRPKKATGSSRPQIEWQVSRKQDLLTLVDLLDQYPLRSRKQRDYSVWRDAVLYWHSLRPVYGGTKGRGTVDWSPMDEYKAALEAVRIYRPSDA